MKRKPPLDPQPTYNRLSVDDLAYLKASVIRTLASGEADTRRCHAVLRRINNALELHAINAELQSLPWKVLP